MPAMRAFFQFSLYYVDLNFPAIAAVSNYDVDQAGIPRSVSCMTCQFGNQLRLK